ncbi:unnamed protein product [Prorocentrum cordatum]|uniref:Uncharacterized protein n=1 Tax=Prorocentrum cordatum TaxID=2364126 RepID=A0ABN9Q1W8_9DINO|nr:unnamed protein product [Polarella glacialis]
MLLCVFEGSVLRNVRPGRLPVPFHHGVWPPLTSWRSRPSAAAAERHDLGGLQVGTSTSVGGVHPQKEVCPDLGDGGSFLAALDSAARRGALPGARGVPHGRGGGRREARGRDGPQRGGGVWRRAPRGLGEASDVRCVRGRGASRAFRGGCPAGPRAPAARGGAA